MSGSFSHRYGERTFVLEYDRLVFVHYSRADVARDRAQEQRLRYEDFLRGALPRLRATLEEARAKGLPLADLDLRWPLVGPEKKGERRYPQLHRMKISESDDASELFTLTLALTRAPARAVLAELRGAVQRIVAGYRRSGIVEAPRGDSPRGQPLPLARPAARHVREKYAAFADVYFESPPDVRGRFEAQLSAMLQPVLAAADAQLAGTSPAALALQPMAPALEHVREQGFGEEAVLEPSSHTDPIPPYFFMKPGVDAGLVRVRLALVVRAEDGEHEEPWDAAQKLGWRIMKAAGLRDDVDDEE